MWASCGASGSGGPRNRRHLPSDKDIGRTGPDEIERCLLDNHRRRPQQRQDLRSHDRSDISFALIPVEDFGIIVFDNGSTDGTARVAHEIINRYAFVELRRNARALEPAYCLTQCSPATPSNYIANVPANNTFHCGRFIELFGHVGKADIVTSYSNNVLYAMPPLGRFVSRGYTVLLNILFGKGIRYYKG